MNEDLQDLLQEAQKGELHAFAAIVQRFDKMATGYAFAMLGDYHLAEDAAQGAFFEAYCNLEKVYNAIALPAWLRKILFKHCDRIGRKHKLRLVPLEQVAEPPSQAGSPGQIFAREQTIQTVREALLGLKEPERQVAILFYLCGYSRAQIAACIDQPMATVVYRLRSARGQLKQRIRAMEDTGLEQNLDPARQAGALALAELGLDGEAPQLARYLGLLKEQHSQGQNMLQHSMDVACIAATLADQLGWDANLARRAGLLHDIGKIVEDAATHMVAGVRLVYEWGEDMAVREVIWTHHERGRLLSPNCSLLVVSPLCFVVRLADTIAAEKFPQASGFEALETYAQVVPTSGQSNGENLDDHIHRVLKVDAVAAALQGVGAAYLFRAQNQAALLLQTTPAAGEVESLAQKAADLVKSHWAWQGHIAVTPVLCN